VPAFKNLLGRAGRSAAFLYLLSAATGLAVAASLFTVPVLLGTGRFWDAPNVSDMQQHLSAARYFIADSWRFPVFLCKLIMPPEGVSVVFLDVNPLFAVFAKLLFTLTGLEVNYFGPWIALCYALQAAAFLFLCRSLGLKGLIPAIACTIIALSFPAFLFRFFHLNLLGQFFITAALGLYFRAVRQDRFAQMSRWALALCLISLMVHFYLFAMVTAIYGVLLLQWAERSRERFWQAFRQGAVFVVGAAVIFVGSGYLHGAGGSTGFGFYSMNLLSPILPQASGVFPGMIAILDATGGQYEGYNYLGLGVILLFAIALWLYRRDLGSLARRHKYLLGLMVLFTLFAISFNPVIGHLSLLHPHAAPPVPADSSGEALAAKPAHASATGIVATIKDLVFYPLQQFRASGRFFWPVGYCIAAFGVAGVARRMASGPALVTLSLAAALQFVDAAPLRDHLGQQMREAALPALAPEPWEKMIAAHGSIRVMPSMDCASRESPFIPLLVFYASNSLTPTYSAKLSRGPQADCPAEIAAIGHYKLPAEQILFLLAPPIPDGIVQAVPDAASLCRPASFGFVCSHKWPELDAAGIAIGRR
jgi:hypothetical protein